MPRPYAASLLSYGKPAGPPKDLRSIICAQWTYRVEQCLLLGCYVREIPAIVKFLCQQEELLTQITEVYTSNGPFS